MEKTKKRGGVIPNKLYFRIGEVADIIDVKPYVLRYWESEFPDIKPTKSKSGQRLYKRRDVEMLLKIKGLLYDERFTINGAKIRLKEIGRPEPEVKEAPAQAAPKEPVEAPPKQLEVFVEEPAKKEPSPRETSKVLMKIRKDLESLLDVVRV